jgi:hypothetical protein
MTLPSTFRYRTRRTERHEDLLSAFVWPLVPGLVRPVRL